MSEKQTKIAIGLLSFFLIFCAALMYWVIIYSGSGDGDTLEHVHSAWLVSRGNLPYKDFFQHHNPLLWYIGAPIVGMLEYRLVAVDCVEALSATVTLLMLFYICRIHKDFLCGALPGLIAAAFCALPHISLFNKEFKPDNYMAASLVIGIYYLLSYIKNKRLSNLTVSFLLFFAGFMFTQKAALILICAGMLILWLVKKKEMRMKDVLQCASLPILIYAAFLAFLWYEGVLEMYFKANFELNSRIPDVFYTRRFITPTFEMSIPIFLSFYALLRCFYNGNVYIKVIGLLFIAEYIIRMYYFTPFVYYFSFLHAVSSIYAGVAVADIIKKSPVLVWLSVTYFLVLGGIYAKTYSRRITVGDSFKYGAAGFVLENTTPCDYVVNGYRIGYNLFNKDIDFIWNLKGQIDVIAATIGIRPLADLETLIRKHRPKIIYGKNYYDTYMAYRGYIDVYPIHFISSHLLEEMYDPLDRDDLYILKPQYQKHDCRYNPRTKTFEYRDPD